jgi:hypothetical protein
VVSRSTLRPAVLSFAVPQPVWLVVLLLVLGMRLVLWLPLLWLVLFPATARPLSILSSTCMAHCRRW